MDAPVEGNSAQLIQTLLDGNMLSHPGVRLHVNRALATGDYSKLLNYVQTFPLPLAAAVRNINLAAHERAKCPFRPYPDRQDAREFLSGPLKFGFVNQFDDIFGIDFDTLAMPMMNAGRQKTGKSALVKYLLCQIFRRPREFNVLIPDLKREYRNLLPHCRSLKVLKRDKIKINPFEVPPWRHPRDHIMAVAKIFISENYLLGTSLNELVRILTWLYKQRGIFDGGNNYPTVIDVHRAIYASLRRSKGRYVDILRWLENRFLPYTEVNTYTCRFGIPFDIFKTKNLVLEVDKGLTDNMYNFTVAWIVEMLYSHNKEKGLIGSKLRHLINVDEARILFNANRDAQKYGESVLNEIVTKEREFGIGFILSSQESASFNQVIRSLAYLKIAFPLNDGKDLDFIQESFGLDDDQRSYLFEFPQSRHAVVRYGGYKEAFRMAVPHFRIPRHIKDEEVEQRMTGFYAELAKHVELIETYVPEPKGEIPPGEALSLLYLLGREPFTKVSGMAERSDLKSPTKVEEALKWLEANLYIERKKLRVHRRGKPSSFAVLTRKAHARIGSKPPRGKGGFEHTLYQHMIAKKLEAEGMEAYVEVRIEGSSKSIDVLARDKDGSSVAYEVTLELENLVKNIQDDLEAGAQKVVVVTKNREDIQKAKKKAEEEGNLAQVVMRVHFCAISDFYD